MSEDDYNISDVDIFSRGSLKLTYDLLRKKYPGLALQVRNIILSPALPALAGQAHNENSDHFRVSLDSFQVRAVVENLMQYQQLDIKNAKLSGLEIMAQSLLDDWLHLARKMIQDLADQQPSE